MFRHHVETNARVESSVGDVMSVGDVAGARGVPVVTGVQKVATLVVLGVVAAAAVGAANSGASTSFGATAARCLLQPPAQTAVEAWPDPGFTPAAASTAERSFGFQDETRMYFGSSTVTLDFDGESIAERPPAPSRGAPSSAAPAGAASSSAASSGATSSTDTRFDYLRDAAEPAIVWETVNGEHVVVEQSALSTQLAKNWRLQPGPREQLRLALECADAGVLSPG